MNCSAKKILIVDDERTVCHVLAKFLSALSYDVTFALDGSEALEEFERLKPHLVLLDIKLPTLDGFELLRRFKSDSPDVVVIMMTAYSDEFTAQRALQVGANDFIPKPIDLNSLESSISTYFSMT